MNNVASTLARRGFEVIASAGKDGDKVAYQLPTWAAFMLGSTVLLFFASSFMVCFLISLQSQS